MNYIRYWYVNSVCAWYNIGKCVECEKVKKKIIENTKIWSVKTAANISVLQCEMLKYFNFQSEFKHLTVLC